MDRLFCRGPCKVRNETKTKQNEIKQIETKRKERDRNETEQIETKRNETGQNETKQNIKLKIYEKRRKKLPRTNI